MKANRRTWILGLIQATLLFISVNIGSAQSYPSYDYKLIPWRYTREPQATAINDDGIVAGTFPYGYGGFDDGDAFILDSRTWTYAVFTNYVNFKPGGYLFSATRALNKQFWVGDATAYPNPDDPRAVMGSFTDTNHVTVLGLLPGSRHSSARGINSSNVAVGFSQDFEGGIRHARYWYNGGTFPLAYLPGYTNQSAAAAINDAGDIVGYCSTTNNLRHATLWKTGGNAVDLGAMLLPPYDYSSEALAINKQGDAVGYAKTAAGIQHAML